MAEEEEKLDININNDSMSDSDTDSDNEPDDDEFKKFEQELNRKILEEFHPETKQISYQQINTLSKIVKNEHGQIIDPLHTTLPFITRFEKAKVIGIRSKQLNNGADPLIKLPKDVIDGLTIATLEFEQKVLPFIIRRPLPNGISEYWNIKDLDILE